MARAHPATPDDPVSREALYALVWAEPMLKVGERFDVSSSYLARVCTALNVPRPEPGYWAKLAVGKAPPVPQLPDARPGDERVWSRSGQAMKAPRALPRPPPKVVRREPKSPVTLPEEHGLVADAAVHFEAGRVSNEVGYLKPHKRLLVDVVASQATLSKALGFANQLFRAFESDEHRVVLAPTYERFRRETVEHRDVARAQQMRLQRFPEAVRLARTGLQTRFTAGEQWVS